MGQATTENADKSPAPPKCRRRCTSFRCRGRRVRHRLPERLRQSLVEVRKRRRLLLVSKRVLRRKGIRKFLCLQSQCGKSFLISDAPRETRAAISHASELVPSPGALTLVWVMRSRGLRGFSVPEGTRTEKGLKGRAT